MFTSWSSISDWKEVAFSPKIQILNYSKAYRKHIGLLHHITWLFLDRFWISCQVSYRACKMQAIDANHSKISQFIWELCQSQVVKIGMGSGKWKWSEVGWNAMEWNGNGIESELE